MWLCCELTGQFFHGKLFHLKELLTKRLFRHGNIAAIILKINKVSLSLQEKQWAYFSPMIKFELSSEITIQKNWHLPPRAEHLAITSLIGGDTKQTRFLDVNIRDQRNFSEHYFPNVTKPHGAKPFKVQDKSLEKFIIMVSDFTLWIFKELIKF